MPDITQRIADILAAHERTGPPLSCVCGGRSEYRCVCDRLEECECDAVFPYVDHPSHIAEVLTTELGLRRDETMYATISGGIHHRYVTDWVPDA